MGANSGRVFHWIFLFLELLVLSSPILESKAEAGFFGKLFGRKRVPQTFRNRRRNRRRLAVRNFNRLRNPTAFNDPFLANRFAADQFNFQGVPLDPNDRLSQRGGFNRGLGGINNGLNGFNNGLGGFDNEIGGLGGRGYGGLGNGLGGLNGGFNSGLGGGSVDPRQLRVFARNGGGLVLDPSGNAFEVNSGSLGQNGRFNNADAELALANGDLNGLVRDGVIRQQLYRTNTGLSDQVMPAYGQRGATLPNNRDAIEEFNGGVKEGQFFR